MMLLREILAELVAVLYALILCKLTGISEILIEVDSLWVINILNHGIHPPANCFQATQQIKKIMDHLKPSFSHSFREGNLVAHSLAIKGKNEAGFELLKAAQLPRRIRGLVALDALPHPAIRIQKQ